MTLILGCRPWGVIVVEDPDGLALDADRIAIGEDPDDLVEQALDGARFPLSVSVVTERAGERTLWVEARSSDGVVLGRDRISVTVQSRNVPAVAELQPPCEGEDGVAPDDRCDDGSFCNGAELCRERVCVAGTPPCQPSPFACVDVQCLDELARCAVTPVHSSCPADEPLCDATRGCIEGEPCTEAAECQDDSGCNGEEICVADRCAPGGVASFDDNNLCTLDACVEPEGIVHAAHTDLRDCPLDGESGGCFLGLCLPRGVLNQTCELDADCADGAFCNGAEPCISGVCLPGLPPPIDDDEPCTVDRCLEDPPRVEHEAVANGTPCGEGLVCEGGVCGALNPGPDAGPDAGPPDAGPPPDPVLELTHVLGANVTGSVGVATPFTVTFFNFTADQVITSISPALEPALPFRYAGGAFPCAPPINPGESCSIDLEYFPQVAGRTVGRLGINVSSADASGSGFIDLAGTTAASGTLEDTFINGVVAIDLAGDLNDGIYTTVFVAGVELRHYFSDGQQDLGFNGGTVALPAGESSLGLFAVAGGVELARFGGATLSFERYLLDGTVDPAFGTQSTAMGNSETLARVRRDASGGWLVVGSSGPPPTEPVLFRFEPEGAVDLGFGSNGSLILNGLPEGANFHDVAEMDDGRLIAVGERVGPAGLIVAMFEPDGSLDPSFGAGAGFINLDGDYAAPFVLPPKPGLNLIQIYTSTSTGLFAIDLEPDGDLSTNCAMVNVGSAPPGGILTVDAVFLRDVIRDATGHTLTITFWMGDNGMFQEQISRVRRFTSSRADDPSFAGGTGFEIGTFLTGEAVALTSEGRVIVGTDGDVFILAP